MKRKILAILGGILILSGGIMVTPVMAVKCPAGTLHEGDDMDTVEQCDEETDAATCPTILGMRPWYDGLTDPDCNEVLSDKFKGDELKTSIWRIVLNILADLSIIVGVLALGFIIYGGYMYMISEGDAGKAAKGKKTLMSAIIGLVIALLSTVIVNFIIDTLKIGSASGGGLPDVNPDDVVLNGLNAAYMVAGIVAVGFIVYAGVNYAISTGDPGKVAKAHKTIMYALIGLVIVILAAAITNFVLGAVGGAL